MPISIPTCQLVGIVGDVITFAATDKDLPAVNAVRIWWDGEELHAEATDRYIVGHSYWEPGDDPEIDVQEDFGTQWGGADDPWSIAIPLDDAKDIVKVFDLPVKRGWTPLTVEYTASGYLKIFRHRDTGHSALTQVSAPIEATFPDLGKLLSEGLFNAPVGEVAFDAKRLAGFAKVRQRGPLAMSFSGPGKAVRVAIGKRFDGAIMPIRLSEDEERASAPATPVKPVDLDDLLEF